MGLIIALVAEASVERREDLPSSSSCRTLMLNTTPPITCTMTPMRDQIVGVYMQFGFTELTVLQAEVPVQSCDVRNGRDDGCVLQQDE